MVDLRKVSSSSLRVLKSSVDLWWAPNNAWTTTTTLSFKVELHELAIEIDIHKNVEEMYITEHYILMVSQIQAVL